MLRPTSTTGLSVLVNIEAKPTNTTAHTRVQTLARLSTWLSLPGVRRRRWYRSLTVEVDSEFNEEDRVLMAAARIPAMSRPDSPVGSSLTMKYGNSSSSLLRPSCWGSAPRKNDHSMLPMNRNSANCSMTTNPLAISAFWLSRRSRHASSRCTMSWSAPWEAIANTAPPTTAVMNAYWLVTGDEVKSSSSNLPSAAVVASQSPGSRVARIAPAAMAPPT